MISDGEPSPPIKTPGPASTNATRTTRCRHAHALVLARESVPLNIIQRQLSHANLGTTSIYLQGIDPKEIIVTSTCAAEGQRSSRETAVSSQDGPKCTDASDRVEHSGWTRP
jgi:hypothetical protein